MARDARVNRLAKKAFRGLFRFLFLMGLLLFLPAWTFHYWEAWLFLALVAIACSGITVHFLKHDPELVERRMEVGPTAETEERQKRIQAVASVFTFALLVIPALDHRWGWSHVPPWAVLAADAALAVGFLLTIRVFHENSHTAGTVRVEAGQTVISTGPYGIVRHPFYTASVVGFLATPVALGSWWGLLVNIPLLAVLVVRILHEEEFLTAHLPGYADYCRRVRYRLIPRFW